MADDFHNVTKSLTYLPGAILDVRAGSVKFRKVQKKQTLIRPNNLKHYEPTPPARAGIQSNKERQGKFALKSKLGEVDLPQRTKESGEPDIERIHMTSRRRLVFKNNETAAILVFQTILWELDSFLM